MPGSIKEIRNYAFYGATNLIEVIIATGEFKKVGLGAFQNCTKLRRIVLPDSLETLESESFSNTGIVCGGLVLNESIANEFGNKAGFSVKALSKGCLNNFDALLVKPTCNVCYRQISWKAYAIFLFLYY